MIRVLLATLACALAARAVSDGAIAIQDVSSGLWIVSYAAATNLAPLGSSVTQATLFDVAELTTDAFEVLNYETREFVTADSSGTAPVASTRSEAGTDEQFFFFGTGPNTYIIQANSNGLYWQTVGGVIYNNATEAGASVYTVVQQAAPVTQAEGTLGEVWIEDVASSLYVTVSAGSSALVPTTSVRASGAIFKMNGDSLTTIEYLTTGEFVTANMPGNQPLTATSATASAWEEYSVFFLASGRYAIKANSNGLYLQTTSAGIVNSAFSQASGSVYNLVNANPGRR
ncbi:hypothetical protein B0H16DRAFT_1883808 [Mycena metata]|uniref:Fascin domain-containing protein n=1 Tax=Mycena metata TaxID=1033252 RepID=A0AAD7JE21_9AGAR|nr:hypothetical protein B0H16DRAFT_1883808 [Mycena metata]